MEVATISTKIEAKFASKEAAVAFMAVLIEMDYEIKIKLDPYKRDFITGGEGCPTFWAVKASYDVEVPVEDW